MITTLIYIVLPLLLLSLAGGLFFLLTDQGDTGRKRTVYLLGLRVFFAALLIILVAIGLYTGELGNSVPWEDPQLENINKQK
ncbi:MAG: hypothetical protein CMD80_02060 [Gammaproteobacteria bacterium]|nr:hypothetical protein [Gammaproteobacteria bacterium]|tara:strand:- start:4220 stop:4465 length:246 start_codon:yes stop_codon:yes gene_type:complete